MKSFSSQSMVIILFKDSFVIRGYVNSSLWAGMKHFFEYHLSELFMDVG